MRPHKRQRRLVDPGRTLNESPNSEELGPEYYSGKGGVVDADEEGLREHGETEESGDDEVGGGMEIDAPPVRSRGQGQAQARAAAASSPQQRSARHRRCVSFSSSVCCFFVPLVRVVWCWCFGAVRHIIAAWWCCTARRAGTVLALLDVISCVGAYL